MCFDKRKKKTKIKKVGPNWPVADAVDIDTMIYSEGVPIFDFRDK